MRQHFNLQLAWLLTVNDNIKVANYNLTALKRFVVFVLYDPFYNFEDTSNKIIISTKDLTEKERKMSIKDRIKCRPEYVCNHYVMCYGAQYYKTYFKLFWRHMLEEGTGIPSVYTKCNEKFELYQTINNIEIHTHIYYVDDYIHDAIEQQLEILLQAEYKNTYFANIFFRKCTYGYNTLLQNPKYEQVKHKIYIGLFEDYFEWFKQISNNNRL